MKEEFPFWHWLTAIMESYHEAVEHSILQGAPEGTCEVTRGTLCLGDHFLRCHSASPVHDFFGEFLFFSPRFWILE